MSSQPSKINAVTILLIVVVLSFSSVVWSQKAPEETSSSRPEQQKTFDTPERAAEALITAAEVYDVPTLLQIFGPGGKNILWPSTRIKPPFWLVTMSGQCPFQS
jgi:hypothetical protein